MDIDAIFAKNGCAESEAVRQELLRAGRLTVSADGKVWQVADPAEAERKQLMRMNEVIARYHKPGSYITLPEAGEDRHLLLQWFVLPLDLGKTYSNAPLKRMWQSRYADIKALKQILLEAGIQQVSPNAILTEDLGNGIYIVSVDSNPYYF